MWFRGIYSLLWVLALPFAFLRLWRRGSANPDYRAHWRERLGGVGTRLRPDVWIHAVSVGEARAALPIARALISQNKKLLITCTTPTGRAALRELFGNKVSIRYLPFDAPFLMTRFLRATQPRIGLLMETELWPGLCDVAFREGVPLWLVNARLSEKSARGYARGRGLTRAMLRCLFGVAAQSPEHAERFVALGAHNVHVLGNLKFDLPMPAFLQQRADRAPHRRHGLATVLGRWLDARRRRCGVTECTGETPAA
jgi:3-deoxy-D-manno-octulosonic-acid transferase